MKKSMIKILCGVITFAMAFSVVGCDKTDEMQSKLAQLEERIAEQNDQIADLQDENDKLQADLANIIAENEEKYKDYQYQEAPSGLHLLDVAYENGWLSRHGLLSLAYNFGGTKGNEEHMGEDFVPIAKYPMEISEKISLKIRQARLDMEENSSIEFIKIVGYYGVYDGMYAVHFDLLNGVPAVISYRCVDDFLFEFGNGNTAIWLFKE